MKYFSIIILIFKINISLAQCGYTWMSEYNGTTITYHTDSINFWNRNKNSKSINLDKLITLFKLHKLDDNIQKKYTDEIDSLKVLNKDSSILSRIQFLENELSSKFQIINYNSIGFALYAKKIVIINNKPIEVYAISSNFKTDWNEDSENWFFYYTKEFEVIYATYICSFYEEYPCFTEIKLIDNCKINNENRFIFEKTKAYILNTRFRE